MAIIRRRASSSRARDAEPLTDTARLIAVDWGSSRRRAFALDAGGGVLARFDDDRGALTIARDDYPAAVAELKARLGDLPIVAAGMVGSDRGLRAVPYVTVPAGIDAVVAGLLRIPELDIAIVPGVCVDAPDRQDVMRGEETQVLGAHAAGLVPAGALLCQPGTHNKWIRLERGRITDFATAMTGELFAMLRDDSVLKGMLDGPVTVNDAFLAGVARSLKDRDLLGALFGVRAAVLLGRLDRADAAATVSGMLIGADVAARDVRSSGPVQLIADAALGTLYAAAIEAAGGASHRTESEAAFLAGIHKIWEMAS